MGNTNSTLTSTSTHKPNHKEQTNDYRRKGNKPTMQKSVRKKTYREPVTEYSPYERLGLREDCSLVDLKKNTKSWLLSIIQMLEEIQNYLWKLLNLIKLFYLKRNLIWIIVLKLLS